MTTLRALNPSDHPAVAAIYAEGIATGNATFDTAPPTWAAWHEAHLEPCRLAAVEGDRVVGWTALVGVSDRCCYGGVAEVSIYVSSRAQGRGVGRALLQALVASSEQAGLWTLQAGIFPENRRSLDLFRRCGFRVVGTRERLGQMGGVWRDVVQLERRSTVVGL